MATFGGYTTVREIARSGVGRVYVATRAGEAEGGAGYVVKVCRPDTEVLSEEMAAREVAEFVGAAEAAKKIGDLPGCAARWAKVHAIGKSVAGIGKGEEEGRAFAVTDLATIATAQRVIDGRVRLDGPTLAWLVGEVAAGLREAREHARRGHGNLTPSNVLIIGDVERELRAARVVLCDPAADGGGAGAREDSPRGRAGVPYEEDLRAVGALMHGLVLHSPFKGGWPVEPSAAWSALGRDGGRWRELVNELLDPNPAARPTLEQLSDRLRPLAVARRSRTPLLVGMAAAAVLAGGIGYGVYHYTHREKITIVEWNKDPAQHGQEWRELCGAYRGWYSLFEDGLRRAPTMGLAARGATRREAYSATDPQLRELLSLPGIAEGFDPWSIAHVARDTDLVSLGNTPTDHARSDEGVQKTEQALGSIDQIKRGLVEGWRTPQGLREKAGEYRAIGWNRPAAALEAAAANVNPEKAADPAVAVDSVLALVPVVEKIDASWAEVQRQQGAIAGMGDAVAGRFAGAAGAMVGANVSDGSTASREDLATLERQAMEAAGLAGALAEFASKEWPAIDVESFTASQKYVALSAEAPSAGVFREWLAEARRHPMLDPALDPRRGFDAGKVLSGVEEAAAMLTGKPLRGVVRPEVATRVAALRTDVAGLAPERLAWKRSNEQRVVSESARVKKELEEVRGAVEAMIAARRAEFAAGARELRTRLAAQNEVGDQHSAAAVNAAWRGWRDALIGGVGAGGFADEDYEEVATRAAAVRARLEQADREFPAALAASGEGVPDTDWAAGLAEASKAAREKRLGAALTAMGARAPDGSAEAFAGVGVAGREYAGWSARVMQMRTELGRAEEAMNSGAEPTGAESIESVVAKWTGDSIGKEPAVAGAISGIRERVDATRAVKAEKSAETLLAKVLTPDAARPEMAMAAWRRLGDAEIGWPRNAEQLGQGKQVRAALAGIIAKMPEVRRAPLARQVAGDLSARWAKYAAGLRDARVLEQGVAAMPDFSVQEKSLPARVRYNVLYARLKGSAKADASDESVMQTLGAFDGAVRGLGPEVTGTGSVGKLLAAAAPLVRGEEIVRPRVDPRTLGPGQMGGGKWQANLDTTTADLTFTRGQTTLLFVRIEVPGPDPEAAVYLCTREMSIGDAAEIVEAAGPSAWSKFKEQLPALNTWATPRGWTLDARGALATQGWMQTDSNMTLQLPGYPAGIGQPGQIARVSDAAGGEAQRDHPLQEAPPFTLAYVARLAGSRFPTSAEWAAAHRKFDGGGTPPFPTGANLRDATFERQKQHIKQARASVTRQDGFPWPDMGAFGATVTPKPAAGDAARSLPQSDGILWFALTSVGGGERVHHLVGNVAELVVEDGPMFERTPASAAMSAIQDMLGNAKLGVIGGSALSAPELPIDRAIPMDFEDVTEGYSDVGCRLAFNAAGTAPPRESFAVRLRKLLGDEGYLLGQ